MSYELQNIPFFWTALAHWMTSMLYVCFLPKRFKRGQMLLLSLMYLALLQGLMYLTAPQNGLLFNLLMSFFALLTAILLLLLCRIGLRQTVYYGTRSFILGGFISSLPWQLYVYYEQQIEVLGHPAARVLFMSFFYIVLCGLAALVEVTNRKATVEMRISWITCIGVLSVGLVGYILSSISFAPIQTPFGGSTYAEAFNLRSIVYFACVVLLFAVHVQLCEAHVTMERDILGNMLAMQYQSYKVKERSIDLINRKYHDLKHQLAVLRSELGDSQKLEYLDRMEKEIQAYEITFKTGNQILDTILTGVGLRCQQEQIVFTCVADGAALSFMDAIDLSSLFGNALDNAIEAVSKLPDSDQRLIRLSVNRNRGFLQIRVENRFAGTLQVTEGLPRTTKKDSQNHGYGVKSIVMTVEKYGGSTAFQVRDGWFELGILIPVTK